MDTKKKEQKKPLQNPTTHYSNTSNFVISVKYIV